MSIWLISWLWKTTSLWFVISTTNRISNVAVVYNFVSKLNIPVQHSLYCKRQCYRNVMNLDNIIIGPTTIDMYCLFQPSLLVEVKQYFPSQLIIFNTHTFNLLSRLETWSSRLYLGLHVIDLIHKFKLQLSPPLIVMKAVSRETLVWRGHIFELNCIPGKYDIEVWLWMNIVSYIQYCCL